MNNGVYWPCD
uniref:Uncharacterized protein n=1 Tax=Anguilla anguilla TaxID=7936 RepID=A0A0E9Q2B4_ANGAN